MTSSQTSSAVGYLFWAAVSQALNAGTNVLLTVFLARSLSIRDFAVVAMGLVFLPLVVAGLRGLVFEPAIVHATLCRATTNRVLRDASLGGLVAGTMLVAIIWVMSGPALVGVFLALGALATTVEEGSRWILFGLDQARTGAGLDALWAIIQVGALVTSMDSPDVAAGAWAAGAACSAIAGWAAVRRHTTIASVRETRPTRVWQWGLEHVVAASALNLAILIAPITGGLQSAAGLRGATTLLGATSVLLGGAQQAVTGRLRSLDQTNMRRWGRLIGLGLATVVLVACLPVLAITPGLGRQLLGDTWEATRVVLPALIVQRVATAATCGPMFVLRKAAGHTAGLWWRLGLTIGTLVSVLVASAYGSALGAAWALTVGALVSVPIWTRMLTRATLNAKSSTAVA